MTTAKVAISADFLTAFSHLPRQVQGKVTELVNKFRNDPASPGIHYEKINSCIDKKIYSIRIDDTYRGIVVRQSEVYLLLWVDHHDDFRFLMYKRFPNRSQHTVSRFCFLLSKTRICFG